MTDPTAGDESKITVKGHFSRLVDLYMVTVVRNADGLASNDPRLLSAVHQLVVEMEEFWRRVQSTGAFSANDDLEDYSTTALEMLWAPYVVGDLYQRFQDRPALPLAAGANSSTPITTTTDRMDGERELLRREAQDGDTNAYVSAYATFMSTRREDLRSVTRQEALARSHAWFKEFFDWMQNIEIISEADIDRYSIYRPDQRTARIDLSRLCAQLKTAWDESEGKVGYLRARRRRMQELMDVDGEEIEEGGEEEEALRERALARLRWSAYDACHQLQLSVRELEMLEALDPSQRAAISADYQATMDAVRRGELSLGRQTYTILPGGNMSIGTAQNPVPVDPGRVGVTLPRALTTGTGQQQQQQGQSVFRQQVRDELMMDRNRPTMTLQEFAALEMADVQRQMDEAAEMQRMRAEEDERLGPEGIEERERVKDSKWADWKDDNPANGITAKGNYS